MTQTPIVSICVPVYNGEKYLARFLESAITQTFDAIEIICVDNHSTDSSKEIICRYAEKYPGKVLYFQTDRHYSSAGAGRNVAVRESRGTYLYFCDGDDLLTPRGIEALYNCASENDSDLVCGWAYRLILDREDNILSSAPFVRKKTEKASNEMAIVSGCEFWMRLIRKDLVLSVGSIPEEYAFDDVAYVTVLNSYAKNIMFLDCPVYYYFRRSSSVSGSPRREVCETSILAEKYALERCNPKYRSVVEQYVAGRTKGNLDTRWQFYNLFAQWVKEQMEWIPQNPGIFENKTLFNRLKQTAEIVDNIPMPSRVIVNGFGGHPSDMRIVELSEDVFSDGCELVILDEKKCNVNENPYVKESYDREDFEFVGKYFAVKEIYENGGIFVHDCVKILNYFYYYAYQNAFFMLLDKENYSDFIFGAPAGQSVYADLLGTYSKEWDKKQLYPSLAERIKTILTAKYGIPLDGKSRLFQPEISVLSPELCVVDTCFGSNTKPVVCEHDFSAYAGDDEYVTVKRSTLELLLSTPRGKSTDAKKAEEWDILTHSHVYKYVLIWKRIGDGRYGPLLKKIFYCCLKLKRKLVNIFKQK